MKLEHLLLGLITERPSTGYEIKKFLDLHGRFLRSNTTMSQVYRSLAGMSERGWVSYTIDDRPGAQDAKVYRTTPEGVTVFLDWLTGPYSPPSRFQDPEFTARLSFAGFMTREQLLGLLDTELEARRAQVAKYRFRDRTMNVEPVAPFDHAFAVALGERMHEIGMRDIDAHIDEIERLRQDVLDGRLEASPANPSSSRAKASDTAEAVR
jgi:DNA-binding PadR family transcriptional regulator